MRLRDPSRLHLLGVTQARAATAIERTRQSFDEVYAGRGLTGRRLAVEDLGPDWRAEVETFRRRPAGQFVLRLYREERLGPAN